MHADPMAIALLTLGAIFLAGLAADTLGRRTRLPRVTMLLLLGVSVGPAGLDLFPQASVDWFPFVADLALVMVAFLLGGSLTPEVLRGHGREVLWVSVVVVAVTAGVVATGLLALGWPLSVAVLLGAIATSTDPVAVSDVVHEVDAQGPFTKRLLGIVAVDDAWGIVAMSAALALVLGMEGSAAVSGVLREGATEILGAVLVGCALGVPMAALTGRVRPGEPTQAEALGGVLLCGGVALTLGVSLLLAAMTMGVVVANLARHHRRPFRAIEGIEWPFMVLFFVLSGATLQLARLESAASLTAGYVALRILGRIGGGAVATWGAGASGRALGLALFPQAGIAIGMALVASQRVPDVGPSLLAAAVAGTILFEIGGPLLTRIQLDRSGEAGRGAQGLG